MDNESGPTIDEDIFYAVTLDESWNVMVFTNKFNSKIQSYRFNIGSCSQISKEVKSKDLFGMGYPYHIKLYGEKNLAITSDYGVLFFVLEGF